MRPDGPLVRLMAFDWYKNILNEDLNDLIAFLHSLKPVKTQSYRSGLLLRLSAPSREQLRRRRCFGLGASAQEVKHVRRGA